MNWLNTSARWPPPITSASCSTSASILAARQVARGASSTSAGVQAELAQQRERPQDREPVARPRRRSGRVPSAARAAGGVW